MKRRNLFYLLFVSTVIVIRLGVFFVPNVDFTFLDFVLHHFWFGILLISVSFLFMKKKHFRIILFAIGCGLFVDELAFMMMGAGGDNEYWGWLSVGGTILIGCIVGIFRKNLLIFIQKPFKDKIL